MPAEVVAETDRPMRSSALWQSDQGTHSEEGKVLACSVRRRLTWFRQKALSFQEESIGHKAERRPISLFKAASIIGAFITEQLS
ncbi:MAG: hypothetical protein ACYC67_26510 [Prosthecobacter sp.]